MQASSIWSPPQGTLGLIVSEARERVRELERGSAALERVAASTQAAPSFAAALHGPAVGVIAEIKRRSPSKGWINPDLSPADHAAAYERGGAAAISVLTEPAHFGGSPDDLRAVRRRVQIPVLKKDFHVAPIQLVEARALGASAALLIARALSPDDLRTMMRTARELALEVLVEVRDEDELGRALDEGAAIVGVNNRNLETLAIDASTAARLVARVPPELVAIAESGVTSREDVERVARAGANGVLVGSAISAAADAEAAVRGLGGVPRESRHAR